MSLLTAMRDGNSGPFNLLEFFLNQLVSKYGRTSSK